MSYAQIQGFYETPPLWKGMQFGMEQFVFPECDVNQDVEVEIPDGLRLGHQMEYVFEYLIKRSKTYEVVLKNIPVLEGKTTVGEIDFILKDLVRDEVVHVELTYKFYVIDPSISEPIHRLLGPNRRDMFFTKLDKMKTAQFPLLKHPTILEQLETMGLELNSLSQKVCFKAQLFVPFETPNISIRPLHKNCIVGYWLRLETLEQTSFASFQYYIPFKKEWVLKPSEEVSWISHFDMLMEVNIRLLKKNAPMLWVRHSEGHYDKCFVVWW
ncbi:MAG: DUF1853 family protein [Bacteroidota bacterium]